LKNFDNVSVFQKIKKIFKDLNEPHALKDIN